MWFRCDRRARAAALAGWLIGGAALAPAAAAVVVDRILAVVDNQLITLSDLQRHRALFAPDAAAEDLVQELIDRALLLNEARRFDIERPTPAELDAATDELARRLGGRERLAAVRGGLGLAQSELERLLAELLLVRRLVEQRIEFFVFVSPTEVDDVYAAEADREPFAGMAPEAAKRQIEQRLFQAKVREKQRSYLARLRSRATIQLNPRGAA